MTGCNFLYVCFFGRITVFPLSFSRFQWHQKYNCKHQPSSHRHFSPFNLLNYLRIISIQTTIYHIQILQKLPTFRYSLGVQSKLLLSNTTQQARSQKSFLPLENNRCSDFKELICGIKWGRKEIWPISKSIKDVEHAESNHVLFLDTRWKTTSRMHVLSSPKTAPWNFLGVK